MRILARRRNRLVPALDGRRPAAVAAALVLVLIPAALPGAPPADAANRAADAQPARGVWPLSPRPQVIRGFDPPDVDWGAGHRGVDLAASVGQEVLAAADGVVTFAGPIAGRGVVTVTHGDLRTTYEPVTAVVTEGDPVSAGDVVGHLQPPTGHCVPVRPCLHWGLLRGREYLNPLTLLRRGPSRLLPVWGIPAPYADPVPSGPERGLRHDGSTPSDWAFGGSSPGSPVPHAPPPDDLGRDLLGPNLLVPNPVTPGLLASFLVSPDRLPPADLGASRNPARYGSPASSPGPARLRYHEFAGGGGDGRYPGAIRAAAVELRPAVVDHTRASPVLDLGSALGGFSMLGLAGMVCLVRLPQGVTLMRRLRRHRRPRRGTSGQSRKYVRPSWIGLLAARPYTAGLLAACRAREGHGSASGVRGTPPEHGDLSVSSSAGGVAGPARWSRGFDWLARSSESGRTPPGLLAPVLRLPSTHDPEAGGGTPEDDDDLLWDEAECTCRPRPWKVDATLAGGVASAQFGESHAEFFDLETERRRRRPAQPSDDTA